MTNKIRTFIAIELSDEAKQEIERVIEELKKANVLIRWAKSKTVHLTLKFLGGVEEEKLASISESLKKIAKEHTPFGIKMDGIGAFPEWSRPKVLWVGLGGDKSEVISVADEVGSAMAGLGFEKDNKEFRPHLTLGRVKSSKNIEKLKEISDSIEIKAVSIPVSSLVLFRSELTEEGAIHTPIEKIDFSE